MSAGVSTAHAQTFTSPPGETRGLFGGDVLPNAARSTRQLSSWFDFGGGYDFAHLSVAGIDRIEIGTQTDRLNYNTVEEFRHFDNIVIGDAYVGPPPP